MKISHIDSINRNRQYIGLENGDVLLLSRKDVILLQIREGEEISQEVWDQARNQMRKDCLARSGMILQSRDYSRKRLGDKLLGYGYPRQLVDEILDSLREAGYLNDARLAQNYVRCHLEDRSMRRIRMDLERQGISGNLIDAAFAAVRDEAPELFDDAEAGQIRELLRKRHFDCKGADWNEKQKTRAFLFRKGYSAETIEHVLHSE